MFAYATCFPRVDLEKNCINTSLSQRMSMFSAKKIMACVWSLFLLLGFVSCCVSLPQMQYVNNKPYHLMQYTECRGGKVYEVDNVQDIDECKLACVQHDCAAVNLYKLNDFQFKCEILAYVRGYFPTQGAACYVSYY